uniref:THAP domain-containing protein 1 n=1 Tax=Stegastes partitus TaxID=144197 RepID=A0A3B5A816_9TELE
MPWRCCVPGCKGYDEAKSMGVVFHGLPTRDPQRCRTWLKAIQNPRFDENTPVSRYSGVRVCSLHFTAEDYEEDFRAKILNIAPKPMLKGGAVPSWWMTCKIFVFSVQCRKKISNKLVKFRQD